MRIREFASTNIDRSGYMNGAEKSLNLHMIWCSSHPECCPVLEVSGLHASIDFIFLQCLQLPSLHRFKHLIGSGLLPRGKPCLKLYTWPLRKAFDIQLLQIRPHCCLLTVRRACKIEFAPCMSGPRLCLFTYPLSSLETFISQASPSTPSPSDRLFDTGVLTQSLATSFQLPAGFELVSCVRPLSIHVKFEGKVCGERTKTEDLSTEIDLWQVRH